MKHYPLIFVATCMIASYLLPDPSNADTLVMPRELVDFARSNGCEAIDNFFERPGMINPPFVYGWIPGSPERSAVLWCKKKQPSDKPYKLMIKVVDPKQLGGCPAEIEWWNPPRGLSIETHSEVDLSKFREVSEPKRTGPKSVVANARVIVDSYDGVGDIFYCYRGQWFFRGQD